MIFSIDLFLGSTRLLVVNESLPYSPQSLQSNKRYLLGYKKHNHLSNEADSKELSLLQGNQQAILPESDIPAIPAH